MGDHSKIASRIFGRHLNIHDEDEHDETNTSNKPNSDRPILKIPLVNSEETEENSNTPQNIREHEPSAQEEHEFENIFDHLVGSPQTSGAQKEPHAQQTPEDTTHLDDIFDGIHNIHNEIIEEPKVQEKGPEDRVDIKVGGTEQQDQVEPQADSEEKREEVNEKIDNNEELTEGDDGMHDEETKVNEEETEAKGESQQEEGELLVLNFQAPSVTETDHEEILDKSIINGEPEDHSHLDDLFADHEIEPQNTGFENPSQDEVEAESFDTSDQEPQNISVEQSETENEEQQNISFEKPEPQQTESLNVNLEQTESETGEDQNAEFEQTEQKDIELQPQSAEVENTSVFQSSLDEIDLEDGEEGIIQGDDVEVLNKEDIGLDGEEEDFKPVGSNEEDDMDISFEVDEDETQNIRQIHNDLSDEGQTEELDANIVEQPTAEEAAGEAPSEANVDEYSFEVEVPEASEVEQVENAETVLEDNNKLAEEEISFEVNNESPEEVNFEENNETTKDEVNFEVYEEAEDNINFNDVQQDNDEFAVQVESQQNADELQEAAQQQEPKSQTYTSELGKAEEMLAELAMTYTEIQTMSSEIHDFLANNLEVITKERVIICLEDSEISLEDYKNFFTDSLHDLRKILVYNKVREIEMQHLFENFIGSLDVGEFTRVKYTIAGEPLKNVINIKNSVSMNIYEALDNVVETELDKGTSAFILCDKLEVNFEDYIEDIRSARLNCENAYLVILDGVVLEEETIRKAQKYGVKILNIDAPVSLINRILEKIKAEIV